MKSLRELAMDAVNSSIESQRDDNRLTQNEATVFRSAMHAFFSIATIQGGPATTYLQTREALLEDGWKQPKDSGRDKLSEEAEPQQTVANRIVRPKDGGYFTFSEGFALIHPELHAAAVSIYGDERHDTGDFENNSISVELPREFWNVSVAVMYSEVLWRAGGSTYAKKQSDYVSLNHVRNKAPVHYENSKYIRVEGSSTTSGRDGYGNYFTAEASGVKLANGEIPISFVARANSRML